MTYLQAVLGIGQESTSSFRAFLLKPLLYQNASVLGEVRKQSDRRIVIPLASGPPQSLVSRLLTWERISIQKCFYALANDCLTFPKIKFVLKERYPWVGCWASDENVVPVIQVPYLHIFG